MNEKVLSIIVKAQDQASKVFDRIGERTLDYAKKAVFAFGAAATAATGFALKSAADFEQTRIGLQNMLGSADAAKRVLAEVSDFAAQTPFEFPELAGSVRQLIAFGFSGDDAIKTMKQLGDVSAAVGAPIGDISYLMGTLRTQGRAFTVDIRQFAQRGIPIYEYLAKVLKTTESNIGGLIEAGKIGFPEVQKAFELMTAEGGKFHGAMASQSKSLSGLFSTLKDNLAQTGRELVGINEAGDIRTGSLFDKLRIATQGVIDNLPRLISLMQRFGEQALPIIAQWGENIQDIAERVGDYLLPKVEALWNSISTKLLPILVQLWQNVLLPLIPVIGVTLVAALGLALDTINLLVTAFSWVITALQNGNPIIWALVGVFGALATAMALNAAFNAITVAFNTFTLITIPKAMASLSAFRALVAAPMVMPAIAVGAAVASIAVVYNKIQETRKALDDLNRSITKNNDSREQAMKDVIADYKAGRISKEQYQRFFKSISQRASGGPVSAGKPYIVGEREPELFVPNQSGTILNQQQMSSAGIGGVSNNFHGNIILATPEAVDRFADRFEMAALGAGV